MVRALMLAAVAAVLLTPCAYATHHTPGAPGQETHDDPPRPPTLITGESTIVNVDIPSGNRPAGVVTYEIEPAPVVQLDTDRTGTLAWNSNETTGLRIPIRLTVGHTQPAGRFLAARMLLRWSNGVQESVDVWAIARSTSVTVAKKMGAEVVPIPESAAPGGIVRLRFTVYNDDDTDERVLVHAVGGPGWRLRDPNAAGREWLVEGYDEIEDSIDLEVPPDAPIGSRQLVRLLVEVVGEPGVLQAETYVAIVNRVRGRPGAPVVSGTSTLGISGVGAMGIRDAQSMAALQFATAFQSQSSASFSYERGVRNSLSNYRYDEELTQIAGSVRHSGWDMSFGNRLPSPGNAVTGPFVQGIGGAVQRQSDRVVAELVVARPAQFGGDAGGHLVRGRAGVRGRNGLIGVEWSDFGRPDGGYTTLPAVQQLPLTADEQEWLEVERTIAARAPSNRVQAIGIQMEFRPVRGHRFTARSGAVRLSNAVGERLTSPVGEAAYSFSAPRAATLNLRWREMPQTLPGVYISGDERRIDGSLRVVGTLRVVGGAFESSAETLHRAFQSRSAGASSGLSYLRNAYRLEARWNYRESHFRQRNIRRTISVNGGMPFGPLRVSAYADAGTQDDGMLMKRIAYYRGDLHWTGDPGSLSVNVMHADYGATPIQRVDFIGSLNLDRWELAGGAWATRGYISGGEPGMWGSVGVPVGRDLLTVIGVDRASIDWVAQPTWRATLAVRKRFSLPLPFGGAAVRSASPVGSTEF